MNIFRKYLSTSIFVFLSFVSSCVYGQNRVINVKEIPPFNIPQKQKNHNYFEFVAIGDAGTGGKGQHLVAKQLAKRVQNHPLSQVLYLGDNFYEFGIRSVDDKKWTERFEQMYDPKLINIPFYAVLGNHDYFGIPEVQIEYSKLSPSRRWKMPAHYYSFTRNIDTEHQIQFFALDTNILEKDNQESQKQLKWLEKQLSHSTATWKIVYGHHVVYSGGSHGENPKLQRLLQPVLEKHRVDIYLAGHDHDLQIHKPINGVYYVISGAGGKSRDVKWLPSTIFASTNFGFVHFVVSNQTIVMIFVNGEGKEVFAYTISKF